MKNNQVTFLNSQRSNCSWLTSVVELSFSKAFFMDLLSLSSLLPDKYPSLTIFLAFAARLLLTKTQTINITTTAMTPKTAPAITAPAAVDEVPEEVPPSVLIAVIVNCVTVTFYEVVCSSRALGSVLILFPLTIVLMATVEVSRVKRLVPTIIC